ncbi:MAG: dipeptidase PepV [Clostridia bacterium]|nr:dipeptidase PepV [Clostridia bacterium]
MLEKEIDSLKEDIIKQTCNLINIPSVSEETGDAEKPFGEGAKKALEYALELGKSLGFRTKNIDNYCGYIEFGEGEKLVGIIGHLDVVPSGDGWDTEPFKATIKENKIYGRGAIDDKGPVVSALYAMKAVKDNLHVNSRVRLILGINEEKDWKCINHYKEVEEIPSVGFSPDADFPCIYAEKGICSYFIKEDLSKYKDLAIKIIEVNCNNNAINVVPKYCRVNIEVDTNKIQLDEVVKNIDKTVEYSVNGNSIELITRGIQAHAAHPDLGENAISKMIVCLNNIFKQCNINIFNFFAKHINTEYNGKSLGIDISDETGNLTLNVGKFELINNNLQIGLNLRIPVNTPINEVTKKIEKIISNYNLNGEVLGVQQPLFVSKEEKLVKTLTGIFNKAVNGNFEPIAIGGGTYARAFKNCVSFGANFPGDMDMCHQANEFVDIDKLVLASKIYAEAIYELAK